METAPLKSFATWARTALIREVSARISVVLASHELRQEQSNAVAALEKAVNAAGGSDKGRDTVADKVAYTWFNRIIALRFMDAKAYTGIGVVSPERGREGGQPEVLAEAKRGNIDSTVVTNKRTAETVTSLLNGMRRSDDPQGEAYALLLAEYCRHWNRSMPFMFEREGDYTELLIPANLLADDSVLARAVSVLTEDVCQDVEVIGWLYQFYISERKEEIFAGFKKNKKAGAAEIPAATQLFTPHWIVRYLVENSLGRLWMLNRPTSRLVDQMDYYIAPVDEEADFLKVADPEELTVIDPACGSGHMLTYAFDLLYAIYEEEGYAPSEIPGLILTHNLHGTEIDPRAGALAAFALTMKARAKQRTFFSKQVEPNICVIDQLSFGPDELGMLMTKDGVKELENAFWNQFEDANILGSLIQSDGNLTRRLRHHLASLDDEGDVLKAGMLERADRVVAQAEYLLPRYSVVVANPPYMGSKNMSGHLSERIAAAFPDAKSDLFSAFVARAQRLLVRSGYAGFMTPNVWLYIASHKALRTEVVLPRLRGLVELPLGGFQGATVQICAFTMMNGDSRLTPADFVRLVGMPGGEREMAHLARKAIANPGSGYRYNIAPGQFDAIPGSPVAYWLSSSMRRTFRLGSRLGNVAAVRKGMVTTDNDRFVRQWFEVSRCKAGFGMSREEAKDSLRTWFPQVKGGAFRKWYGNLDSVVNWRNDGEVLKSHIVQRYGGGSYTKEIRSEEFYFRRGLAWSAISTGEFGVRVLPEGALFNNASAVAFPSNQHDLSAMLMVLNSSASKDLLGALAPTLNFMPGTIAEIPMVNFDNEASDIEARTSRLISTSKEDWDSFETSWDFMRNPLVGEGARELDGVFERYSNESSTIARHQQVLEEESNRIVAKAYGLEDEVEIEVPLHRVSLTRNVGFRYGPGKSAEEYAVLERADLAKELVSYAVGCIYGRYSLDKSGLILADQASTLQDYFAQVPASTFTPDADNVIPIVDGDWFEDDIVERFRQFLRAGFGEEHFEKNLRFVTESLGVKNLRDYFVKSFYKDHVQRYKKRPIYWLFSSPMGSFNALIYMHRYTASTASTVLNEYLREFKAKLDASRQHHERLAAGTGAPREQAAAQKEVDRLRKVLLELDEYEHDVLYPLATQQVQIDLDDGVKANYPKLGAALKKIPGLEASDE